MQAVQCKPIYGKNFIKENIRQLRIMQIRIRDENASPESDVRCVSPAPSATKPERCVRRNLKTSAPKKKALVASLNGILNKSHSARGRKYLPRYRRSHQKAVSGSSLQYATPNFRKKKPSPSQRKKHPLKRNRNKLKIGQLGGNVDTLHNKLSDFPLVSSFHSNAWNTMPNISSNMFARKTLQLKSNRKSKLLQRKLKSLTKFWQNGTDNITKSDATNSDEKHIMVNDQRSYASQCTTLTSSTSDAKAKDTLRDTARDPGTTEIVQLSNKNLTHDTENENSSVANKKSISYSKQTIDEITIEQKPLDTSSQELLNVSSSNLQEDVLRGQSSEEQHEFGQKMKELDYHIGDIPNLAFKRKKNFNSFNKAQTCGRDFIQENIRHLREIQIRLNEKRSHATPATLLQARDQKAAPKMMSQFPMSQTSQQYCDIDNKTTRRKVKNKITNQRKVYLHKVMKTNLEESEHANTDLNQSSTTSLHDSGCSTASNESFINFTAEHNNDEETHHMSSSDEKENLLYPDGYESIKSLKSYADAKVMKQNVLDPDLEDVLNGSSLQQRKIFAEFLNVKMTAKAMAARQKVLAPSPPNPLTAPPSYQKGVLPRYLLSRQEEKQKEDHDRQLRDPDCPPGYVRLPDIERRETLSILQKYYGDLIQGMNMLPVQTTALKIRQKKMEIEKQLDKLQAAIKVFSKPKVFMKVES